MEAASPARLYAAAVGALLVVLGIVGFFYSASFGGAGSVEAALGALRLNAWLNLLYLAVGGLGLLLAGTASRTYAAWTGGLFTLLATWGWAIGGGNLILGFLPAAGGNEALHLVLGLLGLAAAAGTPKRGCSVAQGATEEPRKSKPGADPARQRA